MYNTLLIYTYILWLTTSYNLPIAFSSNTIPPGITKKAFFSIAELLVQKRTFDTFSN